MHQQGHDNNVFLIDMDRIEAAPSHSSHSDLNSTGSQSILTDAHTNYRYTRPDSPERSRVGTPSNVVRRWSQNVSRLGKGRRPIRDKALYAMPSKQVFAMNGQFQGSSDEIDQLANEIEQQECLMQDSALGEHLRMDTIRALPHSLTVKKRIKERLSISMTQRTTGDVSGLFKRLKYNVTSFFSYATSLVRNTLNSIELWYGSMKEIEGHFGSSVGAYFKFLRWLFILNLVLVVFTFGFITLPQIIYNNLPKLDVQANETKNDFLETSGGNSFVDFLTAEGYLKQSILFYGSYTNMTFTLGTSQDYSLPQAYFVTMMCLYFVTFVIVSSSMARSYRTSYIETSGGVRGMCAHKLFCSWDFSISNATAAQLKQSSIYHELKDILSEIRGSKPKLSRLWRLWTFCSQLTAHLLVGAMLAGLGTAMWILLQNFGEGGETSTLETLYLAVSVNIVILIFQIFFSWIARIEDYKYPRRALHITLLRNFMLEGVIVGILIVFWLTKEHVECWETSIGQEIYRLILVDFFISVVCLSLLQLIQVHVVLKFWPSVGKPEFDISRKSLGLIFNQTLLWVGLMFSPLLALIVIIKMILTFYIKKLTLIYLCKAPSRMWRSAQTQTLYLVMTFLSLLGVVVALGYIMTQVPVSQKCGPFRGHDFMFQVFIEGVLELKSNHWMWRVIIAVARPAVVGGVLLTMAVVAYYLRSKSRARQAMVKLLKDMLYLEAKDKEFLLLHLSRITQNKDWIFDDDNIRAGLSGRDNFAEPSSTWRYQSGNLQDETGVRCRHV